MPTKTIKANTLYRNATFERAHIDKDARTVELAFSSEEPVERWFGNEILDHSPTSVRLGRLAAGGPILVDHDMRDHVGVIESVSIDKDRRGRALARFGNSERATEIFQDVIDGIRKSVSVGYRVLNAVLEEQRDKGPDDYRVTDWEPLEISLISVPADSTVGVGRSAENEYDFNLILPDEERQMPATTTTQQAPAPVAVDETAIRTTGLKDGASAERARITEINVIAQRHGSQELANSFIGEGKSVDEFRSAVLERIGQPKPVQAEAPDVGLTDNEVRKYSFVRAINALANPTDRRAQEAAKFEFECSAAAAEKLNKEARGLIIPADVLQRDLSVGTATAGGHTVATDLLSGSFIDMLRNNTVVFDRATRMMDLNGNIAIPRQTGGATAYWVAESAAPTETQQAFDQVTLSPNTVGAFSDFSRKLTLQSSMDVEAFVRQDLARTLGLEIDRACINGSGSGAEPTGILNTSGIGVVAGGTNGLAPAWSHIVDLESQVANDNADVGSLLYLSNTKVRGKLKQIEKASGTAQYVYGDGPAPLNGYNTLISNQVPSNLTKGTASGVCSAVIFGNFADLIIGMWGGLDITVDPYSNSTTGTIRVVALQDLDIAVRHAESFAAMTDALTA